MTASHEADLAARENDPRFKTQTIFHGDAEGRAGNCTQAAIATILGLELDQVPDFNNVFRDEPNHVFWDSIDEFFASKGWDFSVCSALTCPPGIYLAAGPSPRGVRHMVVYRDGELFWDPHPSRAGISHVDSVWRIQPLDPSKFFLGA